MSVFVLSKGGRIENDEVIVAACSLELFVSIFGKGVVTYIVGEIEFDVLTCKFDSFGTYIYAMHEIGSTTHSVD